MDEINSQIALKEYLQDKGVRLFNPVSSKIIVDFENSFSPLPFELKQFYQISNGLVFEEFRILPIFDKEDLKETWDSLERANTLEKTKFKLESISSPNDFLVFAEIGGGHMALYSKADEKIWFEDDEGFYETTLSLCDFIKGIIENIA